MNRTLAGALVAATLVVGVAAGAVAAGALATPSAAPAPGTAAASPAIPGGTPAPTPALAVEPAATPGLTPNPTPAPVQGPVSGEAPLTGLPADPSIAARRVVAVMIDDQADARPQSGLSSADIVWQAPAEGGIPRYMALFQAGDPPSVGPVRSSRLYFIAWAAEWDAVYVHVGGSPQALALLNSDQGRGAVVWNVEAIRMGPTYLWRVSDRFAPHNLYTDASHLRRLVGAVGAPDVTLPAAWQFGADAPLRVRPDGGTIVVPYAANRVVYAYDRASNTYLRSVTGEARQVDAGNGSPIAPKNVVIIEEQFAPLNDGSTKQRLEAQITGTGRAWIATNGRTTLGTWSKDTFSSPTRLLGPDGSPVTLTAGQTFVQVVDVGTTITIVDGEPPPNPARSSAAARMEMTDARGS